MGRRRAGRRKWDTGFQRALGRRGQALLLIGGMWILLGYGYFSERTERFSRPGPGGPLQWLDDGPYAAIVWTGGGVLAVACALVRRYTGRDDWGFLGLTMPPFLWCLAYTWSFATFEITGGQLGRGTVWVAAVVFLTVAGIMRFIAAWPDVTDPHINYMRHLRDVAQHEHEQENGR